MGFLVGVAKEADGAVQIFAFQTVDDQARFGRSVQVELRGAAGNFDADLCLDLERQRLVRLVDRGPFAAEAIPAEVGFRGVLDGVVSLPLIEGIGVSRPYVEQLVVRCVGPDAEGDADEAGISDSGRRRDLQRDIRSITPS